MITREGGCIDERRGIVWVVLKYDSEKRRATIEIKDKKDGTTLTRNGEIGSRAKEYYDKLNYYFFGHE